MTADTGYRWAFSTITKTALLASDNYLIENFPRQSDQTLMFNWTEPQRAGTKRPTFARYSKTVSLKKRADGFYTITWSFGAWSPGMYSYLLTNQWSSGTLQSAPGTILTWNDYIQDYSCFQVEVDMPTPGQDYDIIDNFLRNPLIIMEAGVLITS